MRKPTISAIHRVRTRCTTVQLATGLTSRGISLQRGRFSSAAALHTSVVATVLFAGCSSKEADIGHTETGALRAIALAPFGAALDTAYGNLLSGDSTCIAVSNNSGGASPQVDLYFPDGRLRASIDHVGAGPGELLAVDGLAVVGDHVRVWDRSIARVSTFTCDGELVDALPIPVLGMDLAASRDGSFALGLFRSEEAYAVRYRDGAIIDSLGPRILARKSGANDRVLALPDGGFAVLDVSAGFLLEFGAIGRNPTAIDTLPEAVASLLRGRFWTDPDATPRPIDDRPMSVTSAIVLSGRRLFLTSSQGGDLARPFGVLIDLETKSGKRIIGPRDSVAMVGLDGRGKLIVGGDTVITVTADSVFRYLLTKSQ